MGSDALQDILRDVRAHGGEDIASCPAHDESATPQGFDACTQTNKDSTAAWEPAHDPCSHLANANRLVHHFGECLLFVRDIGWHIWSPPWRLDELAARRTVQRLGRLIANEAAALGPWVANAPNQTERDERQKSMTRRFKWASLSEAAPTIAYTLKMAEPMLACRAEELDANADLVGLPDGVLDLRAVLFRRHKQRDRITKVAGCNFDAAATAPAWTAFLQEIMGGDTELIDYLQRLAGYALSGHRGEHLLPILWGAGANGKSTFLSTLQAVMGDYASSAAPGLLIARNGNEHPTALANLQGRRLVVVSETGEAGRLNEEAVKLLTGGDMISARRMRMDFYMFQPTHLLALQTNHRPRIAGTDEGIWRRLRLLPFAVTIPAEKRDPALSDKLRAELPGIFAWAVEGWRKYQHNGFKTPKSVQAATAEYRSSSDAVGTFIEETCVVGMGCNATAVELYRAYQDWCDDAGERARSQREFGMRLRERGLERWKTMGTIRWRGIGIAEGREG